MKNYEQEKETSFLQYFDMNNLYGAAMIMKLPTNNFEWIDEI